MPQISLIPIQVKRKQAETKRTKAEIADRLVRVHQTAAVLQGCGCPICAPNLYLDAVHPHDRLDFDYFTGLSPDKHDGWSIAQLLVSKLHNVNDKPPGFQKALQDWKNWDSIHLPSQPRRARPSYLPHWPYCVSHVGLQTLTQILNVIFFLGQLPKSKVHVKWVDTQDLFLGETWTDRSDARTTAEIWLNSRLVTKPLHVVRVLLHEMAHAFLIIYGCDPWRPGKAKAACVNGNCAKLWTTNMGHSGHGRAWQHIIGGIEKNMATFLGWSTDLGSLAGCRSEFIPECRCLPCPQDVRKTFTRCRDGPTWWNDRLQYRDDDDVMHKRRSDISQRKRRFAWSAWQGESSQEGRRYSL